MSDRVASVTAKRKSNSDNGLVNITGRVPRSVKSLFSAAAGRGGVSAAALVRAFIHHTAGTAETPRQGGTAKGMSIRLSDAARAKLIAEAQAHGSTPHGWAKAMLEARLIGKPQWSDAEQSALRAILYAANAMQPSSEAGDQMAQLQEVRRYIAAAITGNLVYYGATGSTDGAVVPDGAALAAAHPPIAVSRPKRARPARAAVSPTP